MTETAPVWLCFHCGFETADHNEAAAHFGDCDDAEECTPLCKWWQRMGEDERKATLQDLILELNETRDEVSRQRVEIEGLECRVASATDAIGSRFKGCRSIQEIFNLYDSLEGRALVAEERLKLSRNGLVAMAILANEIKEKCL